jgi:hypothetical protein
MGTEHVSTLRWNPTLHPNVRKPYQSPPTELLRHQELWLIHVICEIRKALCGEHVRPSVRLWSSISDAWFQVSFSAKWDLHSSEMLCSVYWLLVTDVSGQLFGLFFKCSAVHEDCLIFEDGTDWFPESSVTNNHLVSRDIHGIRYRSSLHKGVALE